LPHVPGYRFREFVLSPQRRTLLRDGRELPLIPRYFDLLVFLVERRHQAVHRRDIFDHVWHDVAVSDAALTQAIRTIRRVLDDDSREPRFVRTVSRHGYRFVFEDVIEEPEEELTAAVPGVHHRPSGSAGQVLSADGKIVLPGLERPRWVNAAMGGGAAGLVAGGIGALLLALVPDGPASMDVVPVVALLGGCCGAAGAAGVTAGMSLAGRADAAFARPVTIAGAALGGGVVGLAVQLLGGWTLQTIGLDVPVSGLIQGLVIGAACGVADLVAGHPAAPAASAPDPDVRLEARKNRAAIAVFAVFAGLAALLLVLAGQPLIGATLNAISHASAGAQTTLAPLGRLLGEPDFGPVTAAVIGTGEGVLFGAGLGFGLTRKR
jgi:DNA-binding winged helix-turn-helix (wHTH) protein